MTDKLLAPFVISTRYATLPHVANRDVRKKCKKQSCAQKFFFTHFVTNNMLQQQNSRMIIILIITQKLVRQSNHNMARVTTMHPLYNIHYSYFANSYKNAVWVNTKLALLAGWNDPYRPVCKKTARLVGRLGSVPHLVGRTGSGPRLVADRADVVLADRVNWPCRPADRAVQCLPTPLKMCY